MPTSIAKRVVWVVDDSPLDAERTRRVLGDECHVEVFPDGSAALEKLADSSVAPDVMVLDWVMPGITGVEVCRFLRAAGHANVGILLLTAHRHTEQIVEGLSAGANDYLAKPYEDAELRARVQSLLRTRQLLERAEQSESASIKLLELAPDGMIALDDMRNIKFANECARRTLSPHQPLELPLPLSSVLPELDSRLQRQAAGDAVKLPDMPVGDRVFSPTLRSLPAGKAFSAILSLHDVTERRRLDARRLDFYSIIAHDLRTPLATLDMRTHLLLQGRHGALSPGVTNDLNKMTRDLGSLVTLINDFLELARLDSVSYDLTSERLDLGALLAETVDNLQPQLEARSLTWKSHVEASTEVSGDARRLQQVLTNLLSNAIKFTPERGAISAEIRRVDQQLEVSISDTGAGIAPDQVATLFDRYTRAPGHRGVPGTGLGLMIVREIVEAHGGQVGVDSQPGVGSRFWFRLPAA